MTPDPTNLQRQYQGYLQTPLLWLGHPLLGLQQFELPEPTEEPFREIIPETMLLGKRVERFVRHELDSHDSIEILLENVQVHDQRITLGEIDCIIVQDDVPFHIEIIYKFYLYDPNSGPSALDHWIGPNRKDSLIKKLQKLKSKQLPLIYHQLSQPVLKEFHIDLSALRQRVIFRAQLFVPYKTPSIAFDLLNPACLKGFYISHLELHEFANCVFFIPDKTNWLMEAHPNVSWMSYPQFKEEIYEQISKNRSPLCWLKFPEGELKKFFVVWWMS